MTTNSALAFWTDGGARGNPGPAGIGVRVATYDVASDTIVAEIAQLSEAIGETTNNQAEYRALLLALSWLDHYCQEQALDPRSMIVRFYTDSELMAYQIQGKYKVKNIELKPLYDQAMSQLSQYGQWTITPIRRQYNQVADRLVNEAIDAAVGVGKSV